MKLVDIGQIAFAVTAAVVALSLLGAALDRTGRRLLLAITALVAAEAVAAWVAFVLRPGTGLAVVAGGMTFALAAQIGALRLRHLLRFVQRIDEQLARAQGRLSMLVAREAEERGAELERTLVRARAESASLFAEQERRIAEERRAAAADRSRAAFDELGQALSAAQQHVEARFNAWRDDLERAKRAVADELAHLAHAQKQLIAEAEARIAADAERLESESEQQRSGLVRIREELARAMQETVENGSSELENFASERRRALHELNDRIRRREVQLREQIEREETEASARIKAGFVDVERRQLEQLERLLTRTTASYSDAAAQQFADAIKSAREDAATRLSRELDRSVQNFVREAQTVLADQLTHIADGGARRIEQRMARVTTDLERQAGEALEQFESQLAAAEQELRRRLETVAADGEAERAVLDARLHELARRVDEMLART